MVGYDFYLTSPRALARGLETHNELNKNHIQPQTMGDPTCFDLNIFLLQHKAIGIGQKFNNLDRPLLHVHVYL